MKRKEKLFSEYNLNPEQFLNITSPEVAYILGLLWADGYIYKKNYFNTINIECKKEDLEYVKDVFMKIGKWNIYYRKRINRAEQMTFHTNNVYICDFLIRNDYGSKSFLSADKILSNIPNDIKHYWFRGIVDGDGCFYINEDKKIYQFSLSGPYEQDWTYFENLCRQLKIKYTIARREQKQKGKINHSSVIRITNKKDIIRLGNYIYTGFDKDKIGFPRKYNKFIQIKNKHERLTNDGQF